MRRGDHTCVEDHDNIIGGERRLVPNPSMGARLLLWLATVGLCLFLGFFASGCDSEAARNTAQAEQEAHDKKVALMGHPCTWVAQCGHPISDCPINTRRCVRSADFRSE